jgi:hypothetical protein
MNKYVIIAVLLMSPLTTAYAYDYAYAVGAGSYQINQHNLANQQREANNIAQQQLQIQQSQYNQQQYQNLANPGQGQQYYIAPVQPRYFGR